MTDLHSLKQIVLINFLYKLKNVNTFKYHVSCIDGKISVRIIYFYYLFFNRRSTHWLCFLSCRPFVVNATFFTFNDERPTERKHN